MIEEPHFHLPVCGCLDYGYVVGAFLGVIVLHAPEPLPSDVISHLQTECGHECLEGAVSARPAHPAFPLIGCEVQYRGGQVGFWVYGLSVVAADSGPSRGAYPPTTGIPQPGIDLVERCVRQFGQHSGGCQDAKRSGVLQEHRVGRGVIPSSTRVAAVDALPAYFTRMETLVLSPKASRSGCTRDCERPEEAVRARSYSSVGISVSGTVEVGVPGEDVAAGGEDCRPPPQPTSARGKATDKAAIANRICGKMRRRTSAIPVPPNRHLSWSLIAGYQIILCQQDYRSTPVKGSQGHVARRSRNAVRFCFEVGHGCVDGGGIHLGYLGLN